MDDEDVDTDDLIYYSAYEYAYEKAVNYISKLEKNVKLIYEKTKHQLPSFKSLKSIHIYGISFSSVDIPYLQYWFKDVDVSKISVEVSFYGEREKDYLPNLI